LMIAIQKTTPSPMMTGTTVKSVAGSFFITPIF